jgi:hypothetical protein
VYLCRASGEGSHDFRVCKDEAAVFAFYEEQCGRDEDNTLDSITKSFSDPDHWGACNTAFDLDLYMAKFEVWKASAATFAVSVTLPPPSEQEISRYRDTFRRELDKRMDTKHPSASPSTESHAVALREFVQRRNERSEPCKKP